MEEHCESFIGCQFLATSNLKIFSFFTEEVSLITHN